MGSHWTYILGAYGLAAAVLLGYRVWLGRQLRVAETEQAALAQSPRKRAA